MVEKSSSDVINQIAKTMGIPKSKASYYYMSVIDSIKEEMLTSDRLQLTEFLSITKIEREGTSFGKDWKKKSFKVKVAKDIINRLNAIGVNRG